MTASMTAYSILAALALPPGILILMLAAGFLAVRGTLGRLLIFTATALLLLLSLPVVAVRLMHPLEPYPALVTQVPVPKDAQAIVILSAGRYANAQEYGGDTVDAPTLERMRYGAYLHRATGLPIYVTGGLFPPEKISMGELMAKTLREELQVPVAGVETESQTTWENAAMTEPMLARDGVSRILLVSAAWHLPRAVEAFERVGLKVTPAPTGFAYRPPPPDRGLQLSDWLPSATAFAMSYFAIHEHLGQVFYQVRAWGQGDPHPASGAAKATGSGA